MHDPGRSGPPLRPGVSLLSLARQPGSTRLTRTTVQAWVANVALVTLGTEKKLPLSSSSTNSFAKIPEITWWPNRSLVSLRAKNENKNFLWLLIFSSFFLILPFPLAAPSDRGLLGDLKDYFKKNQKNCNKILCISPPFSPGSPFPPLSPAGPCLPLSPFGPGRAGEARGRRPPRPTPTETPPPPPPPPSCR